MTDHRDFLLELQRGVDDALRPLVVPTGRIALVGFPSHSNVGDSAIWLGALASLHRIGAPPIRYACDFRTYDGRALARRVGTGTILLTGGGNLGDLWTDEQQLRERVITDFPDNPIVQLPQSIHFQHAANATRARDIFDRHSRLTLLLRDTESVSLARREFSAPSQLAPDMAFALGPLARGYQPVHSILWLKRGDQEDRWTNAAGMPTDSTPQGDWIDEARTPLIRVSDAAVHGAPALARAAGSAVSLLYPRLARARLHRGMRLLSSARVVVTDRLHGHILCMLLGIPHVVLDNAHGKLSRFMATWTQASPLVRAASSLEEAASAASVLERAQRE